MSVCAKMIRVKFISRATELSLRDINLIKQMFCQQIMSPNEPLFRYTVTIYKFVVNPNTQRQISSFKVHRLNVLDYKSGTSIYKYLHTIIIANSTALNLKAINCDLRPTGLIVK